MKKINLLLLSIITLCSCKKSTTNEVVVESKGIIIELSKATTSNNQIVFNITDSAGIDIFNKTEVYINDVQISSKSFTVEANKTYETKVVYLSKNYTTPIYISNNFELKVNQRGPNGQGYTKKAYIEFYTGTWCGICPSVLIPLDDYLNKHPKVIGTAVHGPSGSSDPFIYVFDQQLRTAFNISSVPTTVINRNFNWNNDTTILNQQSTGKSNVGLALETTLTGNTINITTKTAFDSTFTTPLKLVVTLVEDSIPYNQANYGHFNLPNPIVNFCHRFVLRKTLTNLLGDAIPSTNTTSGSTYTTSYSFNAASYNLAHCRVIATVVYGANPSFGLKGSLNSQIVTAGQTQSYD